MASGGVREYQGVVLGTSTRETFRAKSTEGAKKQMEKKHGPEYTESGAARWVVGLAVKAFHDQSAAS